MKLADYLLKIEDFVSSYLTNSGMKKYILGLSGGVDSSLVAAICKNAVGKEKLECLIIPIESDENDMKDALTVANVLNINYKIVDLTKTYQSYCAEMAKSGIELTKSASSNLKVRMRMCALYAYAQNESGLVLGTDNKDERYVGYFTKYGDGAADLLPIVHLLKSEVVEAAKMYGIPTELAEKVPTAGLFEGQTDEGEMGVTYCALDNYLLGLSVDNASRDRIERMHKNSEHKRTDIPTPEDFIRD